MAEEQKTIETEAILQKTMLLARAVANAEDQQLEATRNLLVAAADAFLMVEDRTDRLPGLLAKLLRPSNRLNRAGETIHRRLTELVRRWKIDAIR